MSNPSKNSVADRLRRYPMAMGCGIVALALVVAYYLRSGTLEDGGVERARLETEGLKIERNVRNGVAIEDHLAALKSGLGQLEGKLTRIDDVSGNQEYFYGLEKTSGARVSVLRPLGLPKIAAAGAYQPAGFSVVVEGDFEKLIAFLRALEAGSRLYRLGDLTVQRASAGAETPAAKAGDVLSINLQLLAHK